MRIGAAGAVAGLALLAGCSAGGGGTSAAACAGPQLTLSPAEATVGQQVTATVEWLHSGCDDTGGADEERPLVDVPVSFVQGGTTVLLDEVSGTGERYSATLVFPVPAEATPGPAELTVAGSGVLPATLTVLP